MNPNHLLGLIIQSFFEHLKYHVRNFCQLAFLRHLLPQPAIEVFVSTSFPTGRIARSTQRFIIPDAWNSKHPKPSACGDSTLHFILESAN
jgi:hypothetical protein